MSRLRVLEHLNYLHLLRCAEMRHEYFVMTNTVRHRLVRWATDNGRKSLKSLLCESLKRVAATWRRVVQRKVCKVAEIVSGEWRETIV
jgi:hypothetical protein